MAKNYYAVKMTLPFGGTYTMATFNTKEQAEEYATELKKTRKAHIRVAEVDGIYNGNIKLA